MEAREKWTTPGLGFDAAKKAVDLWGIMSWCKGQGWENSGIDGSLPSRLLGKNEAGDGWMFDEVYLEAPRWNPGIKTQVT